jgi:2,3-bisphosphoglycerate-independent phosphoglycerate mutase
VVAVLDGLRPDAIEAFELSNLRRLIGAAAGTLEGRTVSPSLTWPAMTSLVTGVTPATHGILADSVHLPRPRCALSPLPSLLSSAGMPSSAFLGEIPRLYRAVGSLIGRRLGFAEVRFSGASATDVLQAASVTLATQGRGLILLHWADADRAGHENGWMSSAYAAAARRLDAAAGMLAAMLDLAFDPSTLLIFFADHGGGGVKPNDHESEHPLDTTIPMLLLGGLVAPGTLDGARLVDLAPTILWALGLRSPSAYEGRVLLEAFSAAVPVADPAVA